MQRLSHADFRRVSHAIQRLYEPVTPDHLPSRVFEVLDGLFPSDFIALCTHDPVNATGDAYMNQPTHEYLVDLVANLEEFHKIPGVVTGEYYSSPTAFSLLDFMSIDRFKATPLYEFFYQPVDILHNLNLNLNRGGDIQLQINVSRGHRAHTANERFILDLMRPHLMARFGSVSHEYEDHPIFGKSNLLNRQCWLLCTSEGNVLRRSTNANETLARAGCVIAGNLPPAWLEWFRTCLSADALQQSLPKFSASRSKTRLIAHCLPNPISNEHRLVIEIQPITKPLLTSRESEVLHWIRAGKTNAEIAIILGISSGTVKIHVERILAKLDVPNRHAAAAAKY